MKRRAWAIRTAAGSLLAAGLWALALPALAQVQVQDAPPVEDVTPTAICIDCEPDPPPANTLPTVTLTEPDGGEHYVTGISVALTATASDLEGSVNRVEFLVDGAEVAQDTSSPYSVNWTAIAGSHTVQARAVDNLGASKTTAAVSVSVAANTPPSVALTAPANGQTLLAGSVVALKATASDLEGSVNRVEFLVDGAEIAQDTTSAYSVNWTVASGRHTLAARAVDNLGASRTTTAITVTGQVAGTVAGATRQYVYDQYQQLCKVIEPETGATLMGYDAAGNLAWSASGLPAGTACDPEGDTAAILPRRVVRQYDARNRIIALRFPDGLGDQDWHYTATGLPDQIVTYNAQFQDAAVINTYAYNKRQMLTAETSTHADGTVWAAAYGYDGFGHLASQTYPDGRVVQYAPNALGQATRVDDPAMANPHAWGATYYPNGALKSFVYANGIVHTMVQNARGLPERSTDAYGTTKFLDDSYDHDANGNVVAITDGATSRNQRGNRDMTYDALDRLKTVASPMYGTTGAAYSYDSLDNLTHVVAPGRNHYYCYDASNRLTNVKTGSCATGTTVTGLGYDVQGNLSNKDGTQYAFDYGNRLRAATYAGDPVEAYQYDGHGRRVLATSAAGTIASFYSRDGQLLYQDNSRDGQTHSYLYLAGSLVNDFTHDKATGANANRFQHTDALGSPVAVTNGPHDILARSEYEPYGKLVNQAVTDGPGYTGHVSDAETGLSYMQQRYYDLGIGRFLSIDPVTAISDGGGFNRYWYASDNPYRFTDPDGRQSARAAAYEERHERTNEVWGLVGTNGAPGLDPHAEVITYMNMRVTVYRDSDGNSETYESRNEVSKRSAPGADDPYKSDDTYPVRGPLHNNATAYGPNSAILTNDYSRGRWLHGGGTGLPDPSAPRQGWKPTLGCTRMQNEDIEKLANSIRDFKTRHPHTSVPYQRVIFRQPVIIPIQ